MNTNKKSIISNIPISLFSVIMGLTGYTIVLQRFEEMFSLSKNTSTYILYLDIVLFALITILYGLKMISHFPSVKNEVNNPISLNFYPTFSISFIILSIAFIEVNTEISKYLWVTGTILQFLATIAIMSIWIRHTKFDIHHFNPAWFIPIVGNIIVPVSGSELFHIEISWFFFSFGIVFWVILFTIFLYRIIFYQPMPQKLIPTLFILIAPPAAGFISYIKLTGQVDNFARILYYSALFLVFLLFSQIKILYKIKFYLSWWAYSFPIATITLATLLFYKQMHLGLLKSGFIGFAILLTLLILALIVYTMKAIIKGQLFVHEE